ncbi:MAG: M1 family aminopeptidase [Bacteroidota bacterium]
MKNFLFSFFCIVVLSTSILFSAKETTRSSNGSPTAGYWQQRTDYSVKASLNAEKRILTGTETITYYNNSPDTLRTIVWHLYQNIFRKDSSPRKNDEQSSRAYGDTKGITVEAVSVNGTSVTPNVDETVMETPLTTPLLPKTTAAITVSWNYEITKGADLRTGSIGKDFGLCQWYPQIAVYDDVRGWDRTQYLGISEFYTEYGNWNVELTVPKNFVLASTGTLLNPAEVLSPAQLYRFNSVTKDSTTRIILPEEIDSTSKSISSDSAVWKFSAENVRDFAWAASPNFVWDGTMTKDGVRINALYHPDEYKASFPLLISDATAWNEGAQMAKQAIEHFSANFGKYVYPQATVVSGPVSGMEYPMMIFAEAGDGISNLLYYVIAHELGHEWYPMMIGNNETNYPFMDEGFNTYITATAAEAGYGNNGLLNKDFLKKYSWMHLPESNVRLFEQRNYLMNARANDESAIMTHPYSVYAPQYGVMAYQKPASALVMLEDMIGADAFRKGMNEYYTRWLFKHPYPADFFNIMEEAAGRDLDWFWNQWFDQTWKLDIAVECVKNEENNGRWKTTIVLQNKEFAVMPALLRLSLADGSTRDIRFSERKWDRSKKAEIVVDSLPAKVKNVVVDPEMKLADVDRLNNSWCMPPVVFDYGFNILNSLLFPLDSYRVNAAPVVGFNLRDGIQLGTSITGNYMGSDGNTSLYINEGIRSNVPDYEFSYSTPLRMWDPKLTTSARVFRLDGFSGWQWTIDKVFEQRKSLTRNLRRNFMLNTSILSIRLNDDRYLANRTDWDNAGRLDAGFISLKYFENFNWGRFFMRLDDEFGTPTSFYSYSKLTAEAKFDHPLFMGMRVNWRLFGGSSTGTVPVQTAHSLTQATGLEKFDSWFYRTPVVGSSLRDNFVKAGGGNLFLQHDTVATNVAALNFSLSSGPFLLFADGGTMWDTTTTRFKKFFYDAGAGMFLNMGSLSLPGFSTGPMGMGFYVPFFVSDPSRPNDKQFAYRWRIVFGVRL